MYLRTINQNRQVMKKALIVLCLLVSFPLIVIGPASPKLYIRKSEPIQPYRAIKFAIGKVEVGKTMYFRIGNVNVSMQYMDTTAINQTEQAYGYFQIRQVRLDDYYEQTGIRYYLEEMLEYDKAERVFMHYAAQIGYRNPGKIARSWNGSGPNTWKYWGKVRSHL